MRFIGIAGACCVAVAISLIATRSASAQPWTGVASGNYTDVIMADPYQAPMPPEQNEISEYVDWSPLNGFFFRYERVFSMMSPPAVTPVGNPGTTYLARHDNGGVVAYQASLDTSWIDSSGGWGDRFEFGRHNEPLAAGWMMGILNLRQREELALNAAMVVFADPQAMLTGFRDVNADNIDDDLDGDGIYGSSGQDTSVPLDGTIDAPAPPDPGDMVLFLPTFTALNQVALTRLTGVSALGYFDLPGFFGLGTLSYFGGVRYLLVEDAYYASGTGGVLSDSYWDATVDNHLMGPEVGARWAYTYSFVTLASEIRGMSAYNRQRAKLVGQIATQQSAATRPTHLLPVSFNSAFEREEFSPFSEWRAELSLAIIDGLSMRFAYTGMYLGGISRASPKIDYTLPTLGLISRDNDTSLFVNSFSLGLQLDF